MIKHMMLSTVVVLLLLVGCGLNERANALHLSACRLHINAVEKFQHNWCETSPQEPLCNVGDSSLNTYKKCLATVAQAERRRERKAP